MHESKEQKVSMDFRNLSGKKEEEVSQKDIGLQIEIRDLQDALKRLIMKKV